MGYFLAQRPPLASLDLFLAPFPPQASPEYTQARPAAGVETEGEVSAKHVGDLAGEPTFEGVVEFIHVPNVVTQGVDAIVPRVQIVEVPTVECVEANIHVSSVEAQVAEEVVELPKSVDVGEIVRVPAQQAGLPAAARWADQAFGPEDVGVELAAVQCPSHSRPRAADGHGAAQADSQLVSQRTDGVGDGVDGFQGPAAAKHRAKKAARLERRKAEALAGRGSRLGPRTPVANGTARLLGPAAW